LGFQLISNYAAFAFGGGRRDAGGKIVVVTYSV